MDPNSLLIGILAGIVGGGYFLYGKKNSRVTPMVCGAALMVYPYFLDNVWALLAIGVVLCAAPLIIRE